MHNVTVQCYGVTLRIDIMNMGIYIRWVLILGGNSAHDAHMWRKFLNMDLEFATPVDLNI